MLSDQLSQLKEFITLLHVKKDRDSMHEHHAQQAIALMLAVACPDPLDPTAIDQLTKDGVAAIAHRPQHDTPTVRRSMFGSAERSDQDNA